MQTRYSLRFESGDKKGETVAIPATGLTIGRKEGNGLRIADASVSGNHARLSIDAEGVKITDLGSTNGTRVGTARVTESRLQAGDTLYLGNVKFEVVATGEMSPGAAGGSAAVDIGEIDVGEIDSKKSVSRRSRLRMQFRPLPLLQLLSLPLDQLHDLLREPSPLP